MWRRGPARFLSRAKLQKSHAALHTLVTETSQIAGSRFRAARGATGRWEVATKHPFHGASGEGPRSMLTWTEAEGIRSSQLSHDALATFSGSSCRCPSESGPAPAEVVRRGELGLHRSDHVHEDAVALEAHIGQIFREIGEVVAEPGLHVLAEMAIESHQRAGTRLVEVGYLERAPLDHSLPLLVEVPVNAHDVELRRVVEELRVYPLEARLSQAVRVFSTDRELPGQVIAHVDRCDVTLLDELRRRVLWGHLPGGRNVVEVGVLRQHVEPIAQ